MIFVAFKTYRDVKRGALNPTGFGQDAVLKMVKIPLIIFTIGGVLALALFFILGWTDLLSGPFGFFRFLFWFLLIPFTILQILFWKLFRRFKRMVQRAKNRVDEEVNTIKVNVK
jgi:amino acid permease